jgi:hypothetical protein
LGVPFDCRRTYSSARSGRAIRYKSSGFILRRAGFPLLSLTRKTSLILDLSQQQIEYTSINFTDLQPYLRP